MIISVNKQYRIESDPHCWIVQESKGLRRDTDKQRWKTLAYCVEFEKALVELSKRRIRLIDSVVPDEIIASIKEIKQEAIEALDLFKKAV